MFVESKDESGISDLLVIPPNGRFFRGPERAKCEGNIDEGTFLSCVGLGGPVDIATTPPPQSPAMRPDVSESRWRGGTVEDGAATQTERWRYSKGGVGP
jgi:hypothetical protein